MKIRNICFQLLSFIEKFVPKDDHLVLLTAWLGEKYIDNTKYVYEYLQSYPEYRAVWLTRKEEIYNSLKSLGCPVAKFNTLKSVFLQLRAKVIFSSIQFSDFNIWLINKCVYIDLSHGHPIKDPGQDHFTEEYKLLTSLILKKLDYYTIVASDFAKSKYSQVVDIPLEHVFISDFARNDVFIDSKLREGKNSVITSIAKEKRVIVYMPTHRAMGANRMCMDEILPLKEIQDYCEKSNALFVIKKHFYHRHEVENLSEFDRIIDITGVDDIDPQVLLYQADALITDYSACYIDFLLLHRPLLFYHYDYDEFVAHERTIYLSFDNMHIAPIAKTKADLLDSLNSLFSDSNDSYQIERDKFAHTYFNNLHQENGRKKVVEIMQSLLNERK